MKKKKKIKQGAGAGQAKTQTPTIYIAEKFSFKMDGGMWMPKRWMGARSKWADVYK